jgi:hypothetical protein
MSLLFLHFESDERASRVQKLAKSGAHVIVSEPRWPGFWEIAKREKPTVVAVDFTHAPSHALETADYISKARETREAALYLIHVPEDRLEIVHKRLPHAAIVTVPELADRLAQLERVALARALEKKEAAAVARRTAAAAKQAAKKAMAAGGTAAGKPSAKRPKAVPKSAAAGRRKASAPAKKSTSRGVQKKKPKTSRPAKKK